jgi:hypothetical protein
MPNLTGLAEEINLPDTFAELNCQQSYPKFSPEITDQL